MLEMFFWFRESSGVSELNLEVDIFDRYIRCQHLPAFADIGCQQTFQPTQHSFKHLSQCIYDSFQPLTLNQQQRFFLGCFDSLSTGFGSVILFHLFF